MPEFDVYAKSQNIIHFHRIRKMKSISSAQKKKIANKNRLRFRISVNMYACEAGEWRILE